MQKMHVAFLCSKGRGQIVPLLKKSGEKAQICKHNVIFFAKCLCIWIFFCTFAGAKVDGITKGNRYYGKRISNQII